MPEAPAGVVSPTRYFANYYMNMDYGYNNQITAGKVGFSKHANDSNSYYFYYDEKLAHARKIEDLLTRALK